MPAEHFTKKANTPIKRRAWDHVYQSAKDRGQSPESAIKQANAVVAKMARNRLKRM